MSGERRHPAEVTANRLADAVTKWADQFEQAERDYVGVIIDRLEAIAEAARIGEAQSNG